jgi:hypothetical protein
MENDAILTSISVIGKTYSLLLAWLYAWTIIPEGSKSKTDSKNKSSPDNRFPVVIKAALFIYSNCNLKTRKYFFAIERNKFDFFFMRWMESLNTESLKYKNKKEACAVHYLKK